MTTGSIYNSHNNVVTLALTENNLPVNLTGMTKVIVTINNVSIDSTISPTSFDLAEIATGKIKLKFGGQGILPGEYPARVVIYDAVNTLGIVWAHEDDPATIKIRVITD